MTSALNLPQDAEFGAPLDAAVLAELLACDDYPFIRRAYWSLLGREPDPGGLANYLDRLRSGTPKLQVLSELANSSEGQTKGGLAVGAVPAEAPAAVRLPSAGRLATTWDRQLAYHGGAFIDCAYHTLLGRAPDPDGLRSYLGKLRNGTSKVEILVRLRQSAEYSARSRHSRRLRDAIRKLERRAPGAHKESGTLQGASDQIAGGPPSVAAVLAYDDETFATHVFWLVIGAPPNADELATYVASMKSGLSRRKLLQEIQTSPKGRQRESLLRRLDWETTKVHLARVPLLGWLLKTALGMESNSPMAMRLRRMEHLLLSLTREGDIPPELHEADASPAPSVNEGKPGPSESGTQASPRDIVNASPQATTPVGASLRSLPMPINWGKSKDHG